MMQNLNLERHFVQRMQRTLLRCASESSPTKLAFHMEYYPMCVGILSDEPALVAFHIGGLSLSLSLVPGGVLDRVDGVDGRGLGPAPRRAPASTPQLREILTS